MDFASIQSGKLIPTLPSFFAKYEASLERDAPVQTKTTIPAVTRFDSILDDVTLPKDWVAYLHPEGNVYFHNPKISIVSNADPRLAGVSAIVHNALEGIRNRLPRSANLDDFEAYVNIPYATKLAPDSPVEYYLIDYKFRSIFWVDDVNLLTDLAGGSSLVEPFESMRHLRSCLEPEFWTHVEYYPCHQPTYDQIAERELTAILHHGCVDDMTAPGSVFPYSAEECLRFLKLLDRFHESNESTESYRRSWTARLWGSICRSRHINRHGLSYPRMDRLQGLPSYLQQQQTRSSVRMALGEAFCLGISKRTFTQLTELWNGRIVYQRHWQPFLDRQRSRWRWAAFGGLYVLAMNALQCVCGTSFNRILCSTSFACSTLLISALMLRSHSADRLKTASDISSYISMTESFDDGLRPVSVAYTLPEALLVYGVVAFVGTAFYDMFSQLQDDPTQRFYIATSAFIPLALSAVMYRAYGPSAV